MAVIEIRADLGRCAAALERLATAAEHLVELSLRPASRIKLMRAGDRPHRLPGDAFSAPSDEDLRRHEDEAERLLETYGEV